MDISIKDIIQNFNYLKKQSIIDQEKLEKLLFNKFIYNDEEIVDIISKSIKDNNFLPLNCKILNIETTPLDQLNLRDYFIYLKTSDEKFDKLNIYNRNSLECIDLIDRKNNEEDYNLFYPHYNPLLKNRDYNKYFIGISNKLFKLLNSINRSFYEKIAQGDAKVLEFIDSLDTIKSWDKLDEIERGEFLKNEIIGKLLYVSTEYILDIFKNYTDKENYLEQSDYYETLIDLKLDDDLLDKAITLTKCDELIIRKVIELYPYCFDMLRSHKPIKLDFYIEASAEGYLFNNRDIKDINIVIEQSNTANYAHYMFNDIVIPNIPYKDRLNFLINTRKLKNDKKSYYRNIDCYIRSVNYYDKSLKNYYEASFNLFDNTNELVEDKLNYLKNLVSKYKKQTLSTTLGYHVVESLPICTRDIRIERYNILLELSKQCIYLADKYELDLNSLFDILTLKDKKQSKLRQIITHIYNDSKNDIENKKLEYNKEIEYILKLLALYSYKYLNGKENEVLQDLKNEYLNIITILSNITNADNDTKYAIKLYNLEYQILKDVENER